MKTCVFRAANGATKTESYAGNAPVEIVEDGVTFKRIATVFAVGVQYRNGDGWIATREELNRVEGL